MRSSRVSPFELARAVVVSSVLFMAAITGAMLVSSAADACPNNCPMMQGGSGAGACGGSAGCAGAAASGEQPAPACACPVGQGGSCACGAECPSKSGGTCPHGAVEKKPAGCGCGGAGADAAPAGASQRAYLDPQTGELTTPPADETGEAAPAALGAPQAGEAKQVTAPDGGTMAPFPAARASHAVATVDEAGAVHAGCEHGAE